MISETTLKFSEHHYANSCARALCDVSGCGIHSVNKSTSLVDGTEMYGGEVY